MGGSPLLRVYFFVAIVCLVLALGAFYWAFQSSIKNDVEIARDKIIIADPVMKMATVSVDRLPDGRVRIRWENLPTGSRRLEVFRTLLKRKAWEKWKIIDLPEGSDMNGEMIFDLGEKEKAENFQFYIQTVNEEGSVVWTGPVSLATPVTSTSATSATPGTAPQTPGAGSSNTPVTNRENPTNSPSSTPTTPHTSSTSPQASSTPTSTTINPPNSNPVIYYYSPDGKVVGTSSIQMNLDFWVQYVNRHIEVGWQNLPPQTTLVKALRATNQGGPWEELFEQGSIDPRGPIHIRLVDSSMDTPHWYKVETWVDNTLLGTFGPVFLDALPPQ